MKALRWLILGCVPAAVGAQTADGWAGQDGGTSGGGTATAVRVGTPAELRAAVAAGAPVIEVTGIIDMRDGRPFADSADQARRASLRLGSNTTLAGIGPASGLINASVIVANARNVIIRHLNFRNPCDVGPVWDPSDGPKGNWNSLFDAITVSASSNIWIDHNSFTDAPAGDDGAPRESGMLKQCHDGALDINQASDLVTVSYNRFALHEKNTLVGSSDKASGDAGKLRVTFSNNLFENVSARAPRVRYGQVHLVNNYHLGDRAHPGYAHEYSIGMGKRGDVIGDANVYDIAGARGCGDVVHTWSTDSSFTDHGSTLNGAPLAGCTHPSAPAWQVPYPFRARPVTEVRDHVLANAGAGNWHIESGADGGVLAIAAGAPLAPPKDNWYLEARMRAVGAAGQLYLVGRHDKGNWQGAGIALADGVFDVSAMRMQGGAQERIKQLRRVKADAGRWHRLRIGFVGGEMRVWLDGEPLAMLADPGFGRLNTAAGIYSKGNAFEIAELRTGPGTEGPGRIAPLSATDSVFMQTGDEPRLVGISAVAGDSVSRLPFTITSSDPSVATAAMSDTGLVIAPGRAGTASVLLAGAGAEATLDVTVGPRFVMPADLPRAALVPAPGARDVPVDTPLRLTFKQPPVLAAGGSVRIYTKREGALVDVIHPVDQMRAIGANMRMREVRMNPVSVKGNSVTILTHSGVLGYDTEYEVVVGKGVIAGVSGRWSFRTRAAPPGGSTVTVDGTGVADFRTVQGALNHAMALTSTQEPMTIKVGNGDYEELLYLRGRNNVTIKGQSRDGVVIHALNNEGINHGSARALMLVEYTDLLTLDTLTLRNDSERRSSLSGQAEALYFDSFNGRLIARNTNFFSEQDTLRIRGYAWFYNTLVAGNVDFIWGAAQAVLFERSEIRSVGDSSNAANGGYIVQARSDKATDKGFVFLGSTLTHGPGPAGNDVPAARTYLARSPGTASTWDNVSFIDCRMDGHIAASGWAGSGAAREPAPNPQQASADAGWREAGSTDLHGAPLDLSRRKVGSAMETAALRARFGSRAAVFSAWDNGQGWDPQP